MSNVPFSFPFLVGPFRQSELRCVLFCSQVSDAREIPNSTSDIRQPLAERVMQTTKWHSSLPLRPSAVDLAVEVHRNCEEAKPMRLHSDRFRRITWLESILELRKHVSPVFVPVQCVCDTRLCIHHHRRANVRLDRGFDVEDPSERQVNVASMGRKVLLPLILCRYTAASSLQVRSSDVWDIVSRFRWLSGSMRRYLGALRSLLPVFDEGDAVPFATREMRVERIKGQRHWSTYLFLF